MKSGPRAGTTLTLAAALVVSACAPLPLERESPGGESPGSAMPPGSAAESSAGPAAVLLDQSRSQQADGDYGRAAASLERAVRIEPANPRLWLELAKVHFAAGDMRQADSHARKALSLAGDDRGVRRAAEALLDDVARR